MKRQTRQGLRPFQLKLLGYGAHYYIERIARLEAALARRPRTLQIELIGDGEIPADFALLLRSVLISRSPRTRLITHARSSLQNGAVLVWLLGDTRLIRDDARVFFRRAKLSGDDEPELQEAWNDERKFCDSYSEIEPEEGDQARVLQLINEYLPVRELVGRLVEVPVLRQFGLVEHEKVDHFLATAFASKREPAAGERPKHQTCAPRRQVHTREANSKKMRKRVFSKRLMKTCLFCGNPPHRAGEHIIAQKVYERMRARNFEFCVGSYHEQEGRMSRRKQTFRTYVTNHVCEKCNHGWMSALEGWFLKTLGLLIEPEWPRLAIDLIDGATRERHLLCQWLLKTAITAEQNSLMRGRVVPAKMKPLAKSGALTPDIWLDLGYSKLRSVALFLTKGFPVHNGKYFFPNQVHEDGFSFTLQMNHLLLRVMHLPQANPVRTTAATPMPSLILPSQNYREYRDASDFMESIFLRTWLGIK